tara:strand:- start:174 stop:545 length:372 start_codon:yes stop_codon:yes gene_type:complete
VRAQCLFQSRRLRKVKKSLSKGPKKTKKDQKVPSIRLFCGKSAPPLEATPTGRFFVSIFEPTKFFSFFFLFFPQQHEKKMTTKKNQREEEDLSRRKNVVTLLFLSLSRNVVTQKNDTLCIQKY